MVCVHSSQMKEKTTSPQSVRIRKLTKTCSSFQRMSISFLFVCVFFFFFLTLFVLTRKQSWTDSLFPYCACGLFPYSVARASTASCLLKMIVKSTVPPVSDDCCAGQICFDCWAPFLGPSSSWTDFCLIGSLLTWLTDFNGLIDGWNGLFICWIGSWLVALIVWVIGWFWLGERLVDFDWLIDWPPDEWISCLVDWSIKWL